MYLSTGKFRQNTFAAWRERHDSDHQFVVLFKDYEVCVSLVASASFRVQAGVDDASKPSPG